MYFRIFAHFASRVTLAVTLTSSRPCYCSAEVILLLTVFSLLVHLLFAYFALFRFLSRISSRHTRCHTQSDMCLARLGSSRLVSAIFRLISAVFTYFRFFTFLHDIAFLFGSSLYFTSFRMHFADLGSMLSQPYSLFRLGQVSCQWPHAMKIMCFGFLFFFNLFNSITSGQSYSFIVMLHFIVLFVPIYYSFCFQFISHDLVLYIFSLQKPLYLL
jgi:hypothetical protein